MCTRPTRLRTSTLHDAGQAIKTGCKIIPNPLFLILFGHGGHDLMLFSRTKRMCCSNVAAQAFGDCV
uniref:Uncharacterized protein n=1 Tax=Physcomitrium patens TaxID=3218 RepID=A0A2K1JQY0_PHYPA|nr:hypothetical protein PHYPA_016324 [Physcomitrium patens]